MNTPEDKVLKKLTEEEIEKAMPKPKEETNEQLSFEADVDKALEGIE
jgi:hypothetical protein